MKSLAVTLALAVVVACTRIVDPMLDPRAEVMTPPVVYSRWWSMVESCSGLNGSMDAVSWYQVPGSATVASDDGPAGAYWSPASNRIVIAGYLVLNGAIVRHEMLHALVRQDKGHPREYFLARCGGVVACSLACLDDAGQAHMPEPDVARITPQELILSLSVVPQSPRTTVDGGLFTVIVTATNPRSYAIVAQLSQGSNHSFAITSTRSGAGVTTWAPILDDGVAYFGPGETKQQYFDFSLGPAAGTQTISSGVYRFVGVYDSNTITVNGVTIGP